MHHVQPPKFQGNTCKLQDLPHTTNSPIPHSIGSHKAPIDLTNHNSKTNQPPLTPSSRTTKPTNQPTTPNRPQPPQSNQTKSSLNINNPARKPPRRSPRISARPNRYTYHANPTKKHKHKNPAVRPHQNSAFERTNQQRSHPQNQKTHNYINDQPPPPRSDHGQRNTPSKRTTPNIGTTKPHHKRWSEPGKNKPNTQCRWLQWHDPTQHGKNKPWKTHPSKSPWKTLETRHHRTNPSERKHSYHIRPPTKPTKATPLQPHNPQSKSTQPPKNTLNTTTPEIKPNPTWLPQWSKAS